MGRGPANARHPATPKASIRSRWRLEPRQGRGLTIPFSRLSDDDLATCVHCGLCLDACPTFRVRGREADSPRGGIYLMTQSKRGTLRIDAAQVKHTTVCLCCI